MISVQNQKDLNKYLKILGGLYLVALAVQLYLAIDVLMNLTAERASSPAEVYLRVILPAALYPIVAWALLREKPFRILLFHVVAISQILFFLTLGRESTDNWAFGFHVISLLVYWKYIARERRRQLDEESNSRATPEE